MVSQPDQLPNVDPLLAVAVNVTGVPLANPLIVQGDAQIRPRAELETVPVPAPRKLTARLNPPPPPEPVKQTTFAVMLPVTIAPDEDTLLLLLLVLKVAETREPPQALPVAVSRPVELTVASCGVFDAQITWPVMSLVAGGWI